VLLASAWNAHASDSLLKRLFGNGASDDSNSISAQSPSFVLPNLQGKKVSSRDLSKRYTLIDFWATWCGPCRQSIPELVRLHADYKNKDFQIVGINVDDEPSNVPEFVKHYKMTYPVLLGGNTDIMDRFQILGLPSFFLLDPKGKIVKAWVGYGEELPEEWRGLLDQLLSSHSS